LVTEAEIADDTGNGRAVSGACGLIGKLYAFTVAAPVIHDYAVGRALTAAFFGTGYRVYHRIAEITELRVWNRTRTAVRYYISERGSAGRFCGGFRAVARCAYRMAAASLAAFREPVTVIAGVDIAVIIVAAAAGSKHQYGRTRDSCHTCNCKFLPERTVHRERSLLSQVLG
jgi:hypothetical protein